MRQNLLRPAIFLCILFVQVLAQDDGNIYTGSYKLLDNTLYMGAELYNACKKHGYEIVKIDVDLVGAGTVNSKRVLKNLSSQFNYTICCVGEQTRVKSVSLKIYRLKEAHGVRSSSYGSDLIAQDTTRGYASELKLDHPDNGNYMIEISATMQEGFDQDMGYYYLTIAHD